MADETQVMRLKRSVSQWNRWREENPDATVDLSHADLKGAFFAGANLAEADLSFANLEQSNFTNASFEGANLYKANLSKANLAFATLDNATGAFANFSGVNLGACSLVKARLEDSIFDRAILDNACLAGAFLGHCSFKQTRFIGALLDGVNLIGANLEQSNTSQVTFDQKILWHVVKESRCLPSKLWERRYDVLYDTTVRCEGINVATTYGSQRFKLFAQDQAFLEEYVHTRFGKYIFFLWWLFADCGRSLLRWAGWSIILALLFAAAYYFLGPDAIHHDRLGFGFLNLCYFSLVTFTTLGFGDIVPATTAATIWVMLEVVFGYTMLGGLITIFASKLARRGG